VCILRPLCDLSGSLVAAVCAQVVPVLKQALKEAGPEYALRVVGEFGIFHTPDPLGASVST
jgi:hypothetical protein